MPRDFEDDRDDLDEDELSEREREHFRELLRALRERLISAGDVRLEPNRSDAAEIGGDEDSQPLNEMSQAIASNRNRVRAGSLGEINAALRKLRETPEDYGLCETCDELIKRRRLELMPAARLCVVCQSNNEDPIRHRRTKLNDYV